MDKRIRNIFFLLVGVILFLPAILASKVGWLNFSGTGQIGDTIGGIMGPFVGILGAWLVYLSFQQQIEANRIQRVALGEQRMSADRGSNFNTIKSLMSELKTDYNQLEYGSRSGKDAINHFNMKIKHHKSDLDDVFVLEYRYILESVLYIERSIKGMQLTNEQRKFLHYSLAFFVDNKLNHQAQRTIDNINYLIQDDIQGVKYRVFNSAVAIRAIDWEGYLRSE